MLVGVVLELTDNSGTPSFRTSLVRGNPGYIQIRRDIIRGIIGAGRGEGAKVFVIRRQNDLTSSQGLSKI